MFRLQRALLAFLAFCALTGVLPQAAAAVLDLNQADFIVDSGASPPPATAPWKTQTLPDQWRMSRPGETAAQGWYRLRFRMPASTDPLQAVYLPKVIMNAAVYLNGVPIGDSGNFEEPITRNWNRPLLFLISPGLLREGENTLHIKLRNHPYTQAALHPLQIGPEALLRPAYERAYFLRITINQTATLLIAAIGILMLTLWLRRRQDQAYGYFSVSALVWAAQSTNLYIQDIPVATATWEILINGGFQVFSGLLLISLLRFVGAGGRSLIGALWISTLLAPLSLWLIPARSYMSLTALWHFYTLSCAIGTLALLLRAAIQHGNKDARHMVAAMGIVVLFGLHDWLIHSQHIWFGHIDWPLNDIFLLHYSAPIVFFSVGLLMIGRFVKVLNEFEALNDQLETRVQVKQAELQDSYARMQRMEMDHAVIEERERIYRDLHDDVGAKLLSLVYRAGSPEQAELARSALQDLRDVVSRTGADQFRLDDVLADWRAECEKRLSEAQLQLDWRQHEGLADDMLNQPQALNLGRILREALSNAIRHAQASQVGVELAVSAGRLTMTITDDGTGCVDASGGKKAGRGLNNMKMRAERLHGTLRQENIVPHGCRIQVTVPLQTEGKPLPRTPN